MPATATAAPPSVRGVDTLFGVPRDTPSARPRLVVLGAPADSGNVVAGGSRDAPALLRSCSRRWAEDMIPPQLELLLAAATDAGDLEVRPGQRTTDLERSLREWATLVRARGALPICLGGDHSLSFPLLEAVQAGQRIGVLWVDAHPDMDDGTPPTLLTHKNVARRVMDLPGVERIVLAGFRGYTPDIGMHQRPERLWSFTPAEVRDAGPAAVAEAFPVGLPVYVSFDIDALDPSHAPATRTPVPGGFSPAEVFALLRALTRRCPLAGIDLMELAPGCEQGDRTLRVACAILFEAMTLGTDIV